MTQTVKSNQAPRPWWKEPWPWFLMAGPFLAIVGCAVTIVLALHNFKNEEITQGVARHGLVVKKVSPNTPQASEQALDRRQKK